MAKTLRIEVASDVICPWCYIGKRRLEKALALLDGAIETRIEWLPFQLNPDMPVKGVARAEYRRAKFGSVEKRRALDARVAQEGAGEGIAFAFDRMQRTPNTVGISLVSGSFHSSVMSLVRPPMRVSPPSMNIGSFAIDSLVNG